MTDERRARIGVFPGSFDPIHNGHLDLIERARPLFDELCVAVLRNDEKRPLFSVEERLEMLVELLEPLACRVESFSGLLVDYVEQIGGQTVIRGLRTGGDFDYELPMTLMNRHLKPTVDTVFLMPRPEFLYLSSRLIKEVGALGGSLDGLVPALVKERLRERLS